MKSKEIAQQVEAAMSQFRIVEVRWTDANYYSDQHSINTEFHLAHCRTVGLLIDQDEKKVILALDGITAGDDPLPSVRGIAVIPRVCIESIKEAKL